MRVTSDESESYRDKAKFPSLGLVVLTLALEKKLSKQILLRMTVNHMKTKEAIARHHVQQ